MTGLNTFRTLLLTACLCTAATAGARMYKWTDAEGNTHYSQVPPADREVQEIAAPPPPPAARPTRSRVAKSAEEKEEPTGDEDTGEELTPEQRALYRQNCEAAKKNLAMFERARRIMEDGELVILTEEERAKRLEAARGHIEQFCRE